MIPAMDFVQRPARFWKALSDYQVAYTFAPNFFIAAAVRGINDLNLLERREMELNFSQLRVIMCGGEANKTTTLEAAESILTQYGAPRCSIKASYGLSEVRLLTSRALVRPLIFFADLLGLFLQR
jgi:acyl-CoA synthetase (AMP-forming)/AMP-acid ligase II